MSIGRSMLFLHNNIMIVHWYAVLVGAGIMTSLAKYKIRCTVAFLLVTFFYVTFYACCFAVALFEKKSKPFSIVSLFSIIAMHPRVNLHICFPKRWFKRCGDISPATIKRCWRSQTLLWISQLSSPTVGVLFTDRM